MAFATSKNAQVFVGPYDLTNYVRSAEPTAELALVDSTVLGDAGRRTHPTHVSGGVQMEGLYDRTANSGFDVMKAAFNANPAERVVSIFPEGATATYPAMLCYAVESRFATPLTLGELISTVGYLLPAEDGLDMAGVSLHAKSAETGTANGATVDSGASSSNGGVANLHVTAIAGGAPSVVVKVQHSTDGSTWADLVTFTAATAVTSERIEVAAGTTVNRYLRAVVTFGGTTTSITPVVAFARR